MALDPPITADEESIVRILRSLRAKQSEIATAEATARSSTQQADAARDGYENLRREFIDQMRKRGVTNPEALMRERERP